MKHEVKWDEKYLYITTNDDLNIETVEDEHGNEVNLSDKILLELEDDIKGGLR